MHWSRKTNAKVVDLLAPLILNFAKRNLQLLSPLVCISPACLYTRKIDGSITHSSLFASYTHLLPFDVYSSYKVVTGRLKQSFSQLSFSHFGKVSRKNMILRFVMFGINSDSKRGTNNLLYSGIKEAPATVKVRFLDLCWMCKDIQSSWDVSVLYLSFFLNASSITTRRFNFCRCFWLTNFLPW